MRVRFAFLVSAIPFVLAIIALALGETAAAGPCPSPGSGGC